MGDGNKLSNKIHMTNKRDEKLCMKSRPLHFIPVSVMLYHIIVLSYNNNKVISSQRTTITMCGTSGFVHSLAVNLLVSAFADVCRGFQTFWNPALPGSL